MSTDFRVSFQGGGANFITLLAASKAIYDFHHNPSNDFNVNMISGTSAGSIVAGILSLDIDPELIRRHLRKHGDSAYEQIVKIPSKGWMYTGWGKKAFSMITGHAFFEYDALEDFIAQLLNMTAIHDDITLAQTQIPAIFTTSDLSNTDATYWESLNEKQGHVKLSKIIANSCAIPLIFKSILGTDDPHLVDGGIVENFPLERVARDFSPNRVIGFSFEEGPARKLENVFSYFNALLSTVINANVKRSARHIPDENIITLPYEFGVLDFRRALDEGLGHLYDRVQERVANRLKQIYEREKKRKFDDETASPFSRSFDPSHSASELFEVYQTQDLTILSLEAEWRLDSLRDDMDPQKTELDSLRTIYNVKKPQGQSRLVFRIMLSSLTDRMDLTLSEVNVSDGNGNSIKFIPLAGKIQSFDSSFVIPVYLFIDLDQMPEGSTVVRIQHIDHISSQLPKFMNPVSRNNKPHEDVGMSCIYPSYEKVSWTVHIPENIHASCDFEALGALDENVPVSKFVEGKLNKNYVGDNRTPLNFLTTKWESLQPVKKGQAAGFRIVEKRGRPVGGD